MSANRAFPDRTAATSVLSRLRYSNRQIRIIGACLVFCVAFTYRVLSPKLANDDYLFLSQGRQIAAFGELPVRDFIEEGRPLHQVVSAVTQRLTGYRVAGEIILDIGMLAAGASGVFLLTERLSGSVGLAVFASGLVVLFAPRFYDYPKLVLTVSGLACCWWYMKRRTRSAAMVLGIFAAFALLYRHDFGVYTIVAEATALVVGSNQPTPTVRLLLVTTGVTAALCLAPFLLFVQSQLGVRGYVAGLRGYAEVEVARTPLQIPSFTWTRPASTTKNDEGLAAGQPERVRGFFGKLHAPVDFVSGLWSKENAAAWLFVLTICAPWACLFAWARWHRMSGAEAIQQDPRIVPVAVFAICAAPLLLRDDLTSNDRLSDLAAPTLLLLAWLCAASGAALRSAGAKRARGLLVSIVVLATFVSICAFGMPVRRLKNAGLFDGWRGVKGAGERAVDFLAESPPDVNSLPKGSGVRGLVHYLRRCTEPEDRVLVSWFAPEVTFMSGRGFAGDRAFFLPNYWDGPQQQQRLVKRLRKQAVPVVVERLRGRRAFDSLPILRQYLAHQYRPVSETTFGGNGTAQYRVYVDTRRQAISQDEDFDLPCFRAL